MLQEGLADAGGDHALGMAQEQLFADVGFQFGQDAGGGGLGHGQRPGGDLQLAAFGDLHDQPQVVRFQAAGQVHGCDLPIRVCRGALM